MQYRVQKLCFLAVAVVCLPAVAGPKQTALPAPPPLSVLIAAPIERGQRVVGLDTADPHFDVVIRNTSTKAQQVWGEDNSLGYDNVTLELFAIDDKALVPPIVVKRSISNWNRNPIYSLTLKPGDTMVREIHLTKDFASFVHYQNFPVMAAGDSHKIRMRAVFANSVAGLNQSVWFGQVVSSAEDYYFWQYSP